jgi:hypothetical protein
VCRGVNSDDRDGDVQWDEKGNRAAHGRKPMRSGANYVRRTSRRPMRWYDEALVSVRQQRARERPRHSKGVRRHQPVGVSDGMRGRRATPAVGRDGSARLAVGRRRPSTPRPASSNARRAAHVIHNTPRNSGSRDLGSAGYGCAPVKRRRRPVMDGAAGA